MKKPLSKRNGIPFFVEKSALDFQKDPYERYNPMVVRQTALHLADTLWDVYPFQEVLDFAAPFYIDLKEGTFLEIGCGVGRWIADIATALPLSTCWGIDSSYQMLKRAQEYWLKGKKIQLDWSSKGYPSIDLQTKNLCNNLSLGLAKAACLPFADNSLEVVLSSFLFDRLVQPLDALKEMMRVLQKDGLLILISPLNFDSAANWQQFYPPTQLQKYLKQIGLELLLWEEDNEIIEPLDIRGTTLRWKCLELVARKTV
jgi:ubiquinone/menaquinone biosynthesis C-methylase UbiE